MSNQDSGRESDQKLKAPKSGQGLSLAVNVFKVLFFLSTIVLFVWLNFYGYQWVRDEIAGALANALLIIECGFIFLNGFVKIPSDAPGKTPDDPPIPHVGLLTILGWRCPYVVLTEGWMWLPLRGLLCNVIIIPVRRINQDLEKELKLRSPDLAELSAKLSITWVPATSSGKFLVNYLNYGGERGVRDVLEDGIVERLRWWAISKREGPATWVGAIATTESVVNSLLKHLVSRRYLDKIPHPEDLDDFNEDGSKKEHIPTEFLFFIIEHGMMAIEYAPDDSAKARLEHYLINVWNEYKPKTREVIDAKVRERLALIREIMMSRCEKLLIIENLGIQILRINAPVIEPSGAVKTVADLVAKEEAEARGQAVETGRLAERVTRFRNQLRGYDPAGGKPEPPHVISAQEALEAVQVESEKIDKDVTRTEWDIGPGASKAISSGFDLLANIRGEQAGKAKIALKTPQDDESKKGGV